MQLASPKFTLWDKVLEAIWAIAMIGLPLTSLPLLSSLAGGLVAPFSILPFAILLLLSTLPLIVRKGELPRENIPLMAFALLAIISCAAAFFISIPGFKGKTVPGQEIRALFTLGVGLVFLLVTSTWIKDPARLKNTLKYISIGGMISLVWAGIQAYFIIKHYNVFPSWVLQVQSWFVVHSPSFSPNTGRISGFTYEASWFAHQMVLVYLPIWIAATYYRTSAFNFRILRFSLENILLLLGLVAFFLSSPRIGLLSLLLMFFYLFLRLILILHRKLVHSVSGNNFIQKHFSPERHRLSIRAFAGATIVVAFVVILGGMLLISVQRDWRMATLVSNPPTIKEITGLLSLNEDTLLSLSHRFVFLERMVYWLNGWNVFNHYPWLGVGLGNAGFFFPQMAPSMGWASPEIRNVLYYLTQLPNVKSLWFRLLAETGIVGFSLFITWCYILYQSARFSQHHPDSTIKMLAMAGQLALLAFIAEGLSIDSFAMPYLWVMAGLISAIAMISRQEIRNQHISK